MANDASIASKAAHVLVVGSGDIGTRHLQAVCTLAEVGSITVVDPRHGGLELGRTRVKDVADRNAVIQYEWKTSLSDVRGSVDVCVVGTMAAGRAALIKEVVAKTNAKRFLIEKVVTQSLAEYDDLLMFAQENNLEIWVNCKTRAYPFHKAAVRKFKAGEPLQFNVSCGNHGLMTNGLHSADLFVFYDGCGDIQYSGGKIDPVLHPLKRGVNLSDLSGTLVGVSDKGSTLTLSFASDNASPDIYVVGSKSYRFMVDHSNRVAFEATPEGNWTWKPLPFEGNLMVSNMTRAFVADILQNGKCELPTLQDCYPAHAFLFRALHPIFNKLSGKNLQVLPVT